MKNWELTHKQQMNAIKNPSNIPALPTTHEIRMKKITPNMFWMPKHWLIWIYSVTEQEYLQGNKTPKTVPNLAVLK